MKPNRLCLQVKISWFPLLMLAACFAAAPTSAFASTSTKQCYPGYYDQDRDGYADLGALSPDDARFAYRTDGLNCPSGYVSKAEDCNDNLRSVHPGRSEVGYNAVDDNCNDKTDEPTFEYFPGGNLNTSSSFRMSVLINHSDILNAALRNALYAEVKYARLSNSANETTQSIIQVVSFGGSLNALLSLWNLNSATVYRARVTFYKKISNVNYEQVGPSSGWYYTMTDGGPGKPHTRALMVLRGLKEYSDSSAEKVGYRGVEVDGVRYGASENELWCSEFYAWTTQNWMPGVAGRRSVQRLIDHFESYASFYPATEIPTRAAPGDYLPLDSDKDGDLNHSAMFLAYDASQTPIVIWTLEGNQGNKVSVVQRDFDYSMFKIVNTGVASIWVRNNPVFRGVGYIVSSMLQ